MEEAPENAAAKRERDYGRYVVCSKCGFVAQYGRSGRQYWPVDPKEEDIGEVAKAKLEKFKGTLYGSEEDMPEGARLCLTAILAATVEKIEKDSEDSDEDHTGASGGRVCLEFIFQIDDGKTAEDYAGTLSQWLKDLANHPKWLFQHACNHRFGWPEDSSKTIE